MKEVLEQLIKDLNNGKMHGATSNIGKLLGVSHVSIHNWLTGKANPSEDNIKKMAKILNRPEKEIQKIFAIKDSKISNSFNTTIEADALRKQLELKNKEIELRDKELELKNKEIELLKKEMKLKKK